MFVDVEWLWGSMWCGWVSQGGWVAWLHAIAGMASAHCAALQAGHTLQRIHWNYSITGTFSSPFYSSTLLFTQPPKPLRRCYSMPTLTSVKHYTKFTPFFGSGNTFSNHYPCTFVIGYSNYSLRRYNCGEQAYMFAKACQSCSSLQTLHRHYGLAGIYAKDERIAAAIMATMNPGTMKRLANAITNFDTYNWDRISRYFMQELSWAKVRVFWPYRYSITLPVCSTVRTSICARRYSTRLALSWSSAIREIVDGVSDCHYVTGEFTIGTLVRIYRAKELFLEPAGGARTG